MEQNDSMNDLFDRMIRERIGGFRENPSDHVWESLDRKLHPGPALRPADKLRYFFRPVWAYAASVALLCVAGAILYLTLINNVNNPPSGKNSAFSNSGVYLPGDTVRGPDYDPVSNPYTPEKPVLSYRSNRTDNAVFSDLNDHNEPDNSDRGNAFGNEPGKSVSGGLADNNVSPSGHRKAHDKNKDNSGKGKKQGNDQNNSAGPENNLVPEYTQSQNGTQEPLAYGDRYQSGSNNSQPAVDTAAKPADSMQRRPVPVDDDPVKPGNADNNNETRPAPGQHDDQEVAPELALEFPNVFTPNFDGVNDYFVIKNAEAYPENTLIIFDRSGNIVFTRNGYQNTWDGSNLPQGTYYYMFTYKFKGETFNRRGTVYIAR